MLKAIQMWANRPWHTRNSRKVLIWVLVMGGVYLLTVVF